MSEFLSKFDGVESKTVFCFWAEPANMSAQRADALASMAKALRTSLVILTNDTVRAWEHPAAPLHPAFEFLSDTHKGDYLKSYLMNWYGGGYTDIKITSKDWVPFFEQLEASDYIGLGYQERGSKYVAERPNDANKEPGARRRDPRLEARWTELVGCCTFIFKRRSELTVRLYAQACELLDSKLDELRGSSWAGAPARDA